MSYTTTATNSFSGNNTVIVTTIANMLSGLPIVFTGNVFGNITANATFYIGNITGSNQITLSSLPGGAVYAVANGSGNMTATFSTGGQQIIDVVPPGDPLDVAFEKTNVNFDQIFAAGPVGSNIQIANNTIRTTNTNGNLILSPNGIGNVVSNVNIVPNTANLRNLGSPTQRWATIYTQYIDYTAGNISFSNFSVSGNINAGGYISAAGNVSGNYILGNGSLLTGVAVSTGNITFSNTTISTSIANSTITLRGNGTGNVNLGSSVSVTGNITANYYYGNGSQLTGLPFSIITNQTISGNGVAGNFALAQSATSDSVFVTINGISQTPETDYTVLGNVITFTTIPIVGDVAQIRFLAGNVLNVNYSNANVAAFLPTYSGNVSANYFIGNGSQLTGIAGGTGNTGNITFSNTTITSNVANANVTVQGNGTGNVNLGSSVSVAGNITANYLYGNGYYLTGLLTTITNQTLTGNNVATNFTLNQATTANAILVTVNGISQTPDVDYTVSGNVITFTSAPYTGDIMQVRFLANNFSSGGGNGDTGNITFNNTTISSNIANANIILEAPGTGEVIFRNNSNSVVCIDSTASNVTNTIRINTQGTTLGSFGGGIIAGSYILGNGTPTQNQNRLATFIGQGSEDGTTLASPAKVRIQMAASGNWSSGNTPTEISFFTTASGSNAASETVRIDSTGNLIIYNGNINAAGGTITAGSVSASGNMTANFFIGNGSALTGIVASANTGNVTFDNQAVVGTGDQFGGGGLYLAPGNTSVGNLQYIRVRGGDVATHIHLDTGNNAYYDQYFGADSRFVKLEANGNVIINASDYASNSASWNFGVDSRLTLPNSATLKDTVGDAVAFGQGAGETSQGNAAVAVGTGAGSSNQGINAVAIGATAGATSQGANAIAIGAASGAQGEATIAIGLSSGFSNQGNYAVAVGHTAGSTAQGQYAVAVGNSAGINNQGQKAVAIGYQAGNTSQGGSAVAIGNSAGVTTQGSQAVAIGVYAGFTGQGNSAVAIGTYAGYTTQGTYSVAVGRSAGATSQGNYTVAVGLDAGGNTQGESAVAVGTNAGNDTQGAYAVAVGYAAGQTNQANNSIILNATGSALNQTTANTFTVAPVRNDVANIGEVLFYNATSKEITYGNVISVAGNITAGNVSVATTGNITGNLVGRVLNASQTAITTLGTLTNISTNGNANVSQAVNSATVSASGNITGGNLAISGNSATITTANYSIGYLNIPQVSFAANATIALTDAGKHYYSTSASNLLLTIANNTSVSWTVGTAITIVNRGTANITIAQGTGVSLYLAGNNTSGNRTMTTYGMSTLMNVAANVWMINGTGVV